MKTLITISLLLLSFYGTSQNIGDNYKDLLKKRDSLHITRYKTLDSHLELASVNNLVLTIYMVDFKTEKVFGIDKVYFDRDRLNTDLKIAKKHYSVYRNDMYYTDSTVMYIIDNEIYVRDIRYIKK